MAENGVDYAVVRNAEDEFVDADAREEAVFGEQPVVGCVIEVEELFQVRVIVGDAREHALAALNISTG